MGKYGMRQRAPHRVDVARNVIWQTMRKLRRFTSADLVAVAEANRDNVRKYVAALAEAQYLRCVEPRRYGPAGGHAVWQLVRNTGPVAPRVSTDGLYDYNLADPYEVPQNRELRKHGPAIMKALRGIVDVYERCYKSGDLAIAEIWAKIEAGAEVIARHDGAIQ